MMKLISGFFTTSVCLISLFTVYSINGFPLGTLLMLISSVLCLLYCIGWKKKITVYMPLLSVFTFIVVICFAQLIRNGNTNIDFISMCHYCFYCLVIAIFSYDFFDVSTGYKVMKYFSYFAALFAYLQFIIFLTCGYYLSGKIIPFLDANIENHYQEIKDSYQLRVYSIFAEPSHFGVFIAIFLALDLIYIKKNKTKIREICGDIFLTSAVFLSRTSTGILLCCLLWLAWMVQNKKEIFQNKIMIICLILILTVGSVLVFKSESMKIFLEHTSGNGMKGRIEGYGYIKKMGFLILGNGMGQSEFMDKVYFTDYALIYYYFGIIGLLFFFVFYGYVFFKEKRRKACIVCLMLLLNIFANYTFGIAPAIFFPWIIANEEQKVEKKYA